MGSSFAIYLFGPMRVFVDGEPLPRVRSRKALWLLALLALRDGRPAAREWIADALWPDSEGGHGLANLRPLISELRTALGSQSSRLRATDHNVSLDLDGAIIDVVEFDEAIKQGNLAKAVELYQGELLEGCGEEWVIQEQNMREARCLAALQGLGDAAAAAGRHDEAIGYFTRAISLDPLRDAPRRGLMGSLAANQDVNAALQSYREFARLLSAEVNSSPDKETTRLYERLRSELRRPWKPFVKPTPNNLVQPLNELVGREDECAEVEELLRRNRLLTLTGVGGIGKTRLATSVASASLPEYASGVWFVHFESLADGRSVLGAVATEIGIRDVPGRPLVEAIAERLLQGRCLLILDNCEHVLDATADLSDRLLRQCPELHILATSREPLNAPGEVLWPVPPLAFPTEEVLPRGRATRRHVAEGFESVRLFVDRARASLPTFALIDENLSSVIEVCAQVEGLPLGIELAAAHVRSMSVETLRKRLQDHHLETLQAPARRQSPRQSALRATLDWSFALLSDEDRRTMARLAVFAGGWSLEAAESVCGRKDILYRLQSLVEKSIIVFDSRTGRYRFLETVRQYAAEKLAESEESEKIHADHRAWCVEFAERARPGFRAADQAEWLQLADREWPNLRKALEQGDQDPNRALRIAGAVWYYWFIRSSRENYRYLEETLAREAADDPMARAEVLLGQGVIAFGEAAYEASRAPLLESLATFQSIGEKRGAGRALSILGNLSSMIDTPEQAVDYYEQALDLLREVGDLSGVAQTLGNLARLASYSDDYERALSYFEQGLRVARELGPDRSLAYVLMGMANMARRQGDGPLYADYEQEALDLFRTFGDKRGIATCLRQMAAGERRFGAATSAIAKLEESREIFREMGEPREEAYTVSFLARAVMDAGNYESAEALVNEALTMVADLGDSHLVADCNYVLGIILRRKGDTIRSWDCLLKSLGIWAEAGNRSGVADSLDQVAEHFAVLQHDEVAGFFFGATEALREILGVHRIEIDEPRYQAYRKQVRDRLGESRFDECVQSGRSSSWQDSVARARAYMS